MCGSLWAARRFGSEAHSGGTVAVDWSITGWKTPEELPSFYTLTGISRCPRNNDSAFEWGRLVACGGLAGRPQRFRRMASHIFQK
jgi:hypothetical protein